MNLVGATTILKTPAPRVREVVASHRNPRPRPGRQRGVSKDRFREVCRSLQSPGCPAHGGPDWGFWLEELGIAQSTLSRWLRDSLASVKTPPPSTVPPKKRNLKEKMRVVWKRMGSTAKSLELCSAARASPLLSSRTGKTSGRSPTSRATPRGARSAFESWSATSVARTRRSARPPPSSCSKKNSSSSGERPRRRTRTTPQCRGATSNPRAHRRVRPRRRHREGSGPSHGHRPSNRSTLEKGSSLGRSPLWASHRAGEQAEPGGACGASGCGELGGVPGSAAEPDRAEAGGRR